MPSAVTQARERWSAKHLPKALLGHVMETFLSGWEVAGTAQLSSPWDVWWAGYRAAIPLIQFGVGIAAPARDCTFCAEEALALAASAPPRHPDLTEARPCGCLLEWAVRMRTPAISVTWPPMSLTVALLKPGAPRSEIYDQLERTHRVLRLIRRTLTTDDTRRLYPEAYGADYVAARDTYLTQAPVEVLVLHDRHAHDGHGAAEHVKARIRRAIGADALRNHLHMPDNPGEAFADIAHLAGDETLAELYERYEREHAADRLAFYRSALGVRPADPHRD